MGFYWDFLKMLKLMYNIALTMQGPIVVMYWLVIYPTYPAKWLYFPVNFGLHGGCTVMLVLDFILNNQDYGI